MSSPSNTPGPAVSRELASTQVLMRFFLRIVICALFALASRRGFGKTLEDLLVLAVFYCIIAASIRRETPFAPVLTHFDEAAAYAVIARLTATIA
jgi:hypothetical protein